MLMGDLLYRVVETVFWSLVQQDIWLEMNSEFLKMDPIIHKEFTQLFTEFLEEFYSFNLHSYLNPSWTSTELAKVMSNLCLTGFLIWILFSFTKRATIKWGKGTWGERVAILGSVKGSGLISYTCRPHLKIKSILKAEIKPCYF